jgi:hypothetical protein
MLEGDALHGAAARLDETTNQMPPLKRRQEPSLVIDGNHLPASEKRLKPLREFRGVALPARL